MPWFDVVFRPILLLPQSPAQVDVRFFFTSTTRYLTSLSQLSSLPNVALPTSLQEEEEALTSIEAANVDLDSPIVFIVHGFVTSDTSDWILGMRDAFLRFHGTNVVRVGWNTSPPNYQMAVADARVVGGEIGLLITRLASSLPLEKVEAFLRRVHIIGHSLGAHIASYAANFAEKKTGFKIGRI